MSDFYEGRMIPLKIADAAIISCNKEIEKLQIENARLKAEVERLRKAGDAMAEICFYQEPIAVQAWLFAKTKEGKQP